MPQLTNSFDSIELNTLYYDALTVLNESFTYVDGAASTAGGSFDDLGTLLGRRGKTMVTLQQVGELQLREKFKETFDLFFQLMPEPRQRVNLTTYMWPTMSVSSGNSNGSAILSASPY